MKCLDTDLLVAILRGATEAKAKMEELDSEGRNATTAVNTFELFYGANHSRNISKNLDEVKRLLERLDVLPLTLESSQEAGRIAAILASEGKSLDYRDALIAGIAIGAGTALVTRNGRHFSRIDRLEVETW